MTTSETQVHDVAVELDAALARARSAAGEVLDVTADDVPLPTLGPLLGQMASELVNGRDSHESSRST